MPCHAMTWPCDQRSGAERRGGGRSERTEGTGRDGRAPDQQPRERSFGANVCGASVVWWLVLTYGMRHAPCLHFGCDFRPVQIQWRAAASREPGVRHLHLHQSGRRLYVCCPTPHRPSRSFMPSACLLLPLPLPCLCCAAVDVSKISDGFFAKKASDDKKKADFLDAKDKVCEAHEQCRRCNPVCGDQASGC
jgi:hypothetical protein